MASLVSHEWLLTHLSEENIRILDCRFWLGDPSKGAAVYQDDHIPGAVYMDLERDLSGPVAEHGGVIRCRPLLRRQRCLAVPASMKR